MQKLAGQSSESDRQPVWARFAQYVLALLALLHELPQRLFICVYFKHAIAWVRRARIFTKEVREAAVLCWLPWLLAPLAHSVLIGSGRQCVGHTVDKVARGVRLTELHDTRSV
jgi:hypothetical protein